MPQVDFYHLQNQVLENVLPKLLEKAYGTKKRIKIKIGNEERVEFLNTALWTFDEQSFIPHGSKKDGFADEQPIWLSSDDDNPNQAVFLFLVDGALTNIENAAKYERIFNIFDGNNEAATEQARGFWKDLKQAGFELNYWQQNANGKWTLQASTK